MIYCPICEKQGVKSPLWDFPDEPYDLYCGRCDMWIKRMDMTIVYKRWEDYGGI